MTTTMIETKAKTLAELTEEIRVRQEKEQKEVLKRLKAEARQKAAHAKLLARFDAEMTALNRQGLQPTWNEKVAIARLILAKVPGLAKTAGQWGKPLAGLTLVERWDRRAVVADVARNAKRRF